jgi:hypothetical protein
MGAMRVEYKSGLLAIFLGASLIGAAKADVGPSPAGNIGHIVVPQDSDDYSKLVAQAVAHDQSLDFRAMRFAYLKSAARQRGGGMTADDELQTAILTAVKAGDDQGVRDASEKLLSVDYTNMFGQKFLRQACEHLRDTVCAEQAHFVEFGLLSSILKSGDGKTCETGWEVAQVREEYFILGMLGTKLGMQTLHTGSPSCDVMDGTDKDGKSVRYFFRIDAVLEDERSMFGEKSK